MTSLEYNEYEIQTDEIPRSCNNLTFFCHKILCEQYEISEAFKITKYCVYMKMQYCISKRAQHGYSHTMQNQNMFGLKREVYEKEVDIIKSL